MHAVDYIIVGQGLAGTCLALELIQRNKKLLIVDKLNPNSSSRIAAGVYNPITGRTNQSTWRAKEIFGQLVPYYSMKERQLNSKFLYPLPIYRPFINAEEHGRWPLESAEWIQRQFTTSNFNSLHDPYGGIELKCSGFVNTLSFLEASHGFIKNQVTWLNEEIDFDQLKDGNPIQYKTFKADRIIFCEGINALDNLYFNWLPLRKLKGEMILVESNLPMDYIINRGIFSIPVNGKFLIGSTYKHDNSEGNTEEGINDILVRAKKLFKSELKIANKIWGHRPTTVDRRPILGAHPKHQNISIFNGLGTKGVSLAPFFAVHFADWLEGKTELDKEVNIERFYSLSFKSI